MEQFTTAQSAVHIECLKCYIGDTMLYTLHLYTCVISTVCQNNSEPLQKLISWQFGLRCHTVKCNHNKLT